MGKYRGKKQLASHDIAPKAFKLSSTVKQLAHMRYGATHYHLLAARCPWDLRPISALESPCQERIKNQTHHRTFWEFGDIVRTC